MTRVISPTADESLRSFLLRVMRERGNLNAHDVARKLDGLAEGKPSEGTVRKVRRWLSPTRPTRSLSRESASDLTKALRADFSSFAVSHPQPAPGYDADELESLRRDVAALRKAVQQMDARLARQSEDPPSEGTPPRRNAGS